MDSIGNITKDECVLIPKKRLRELIRAEVELTCLENSGVDNWTWYGEGFRDLREELCFEEFDEVIEYFFQEELNTLK